MSRFLWDKFFLYVVVEFIVVGYGVIVSVLGEMNEIMMAMLGVFMS